MDLSLSVVIPAYNEEASIGRTIEQVQSFLLLQQFKSEIIVVNDGSADRTAEIVGYINSVKLIDLKQNRGKGFAVKTGVLAAKNDYILFMDADHAIPIEYLLEFRDKLGSYPVIIGSKYLVLSKNYPLYRKVVGKIFSFLKYLLTGLPHKDTQCGFKLFERSAARDLFNMSQINGWCFDVEILLLAEKKGYEVLEFPVQLSEVNTVSKISVFSSGFQMFMDLVKLRLKFRRGDYQL